MMSKDIIYGRCPKCGGNMALCAKYGCPKGRKEEGMNVLKELWNKEQTKIKTLETELTAANKRLKEAKGLANEVIRARENVYLMGAFAFTESYRLAQAFLSTPTSPDLVLVPQELWQEALTLIAEHPAQLSPGYWKDRIEKFFKEADRLKAALTNKSKDSQGE